MAGSSAVIFVPDETSKTGLSSPLMLYPLMGSPLLSWLVHSLEQAGMERFFLVCHERYRDAALACFPDPGQVSLSHSEDAPDLLHVFLSTAEEVEQSVMVVTGPAVFLTPAQAARHRLPGGTLASCVCDVNREQLMCALDDSFSFPAFLQENGKAYTDADGVFTVSSLEELYDWQPVLQRQQMAELAAKGVKIWDFQSCYISPLTSIGPGTELRPGTVTRGRTVIGEDCVIGPNTWLEDAKIGAGSEVNSSQVYESSVGKFTTVGPFAYIRPHCTIGDHIKLGDFVEVKNSVIGNGTKVSHLTYIGDSDVGRNCNFGCGTVTVNYDRVKKYRTTIGDDCFIGCNTNLVAPVTLGDGAYTAAGTTVTDNVPPQALAICRARQSNKRDWAARNKVKAE